MAKRIRNVWPTDAIGHMWAHQQQEYARNATDNFWYRGGDLYSYRTVIARRYEYNGETIFQHLDRRWSNTTNKHQSEARRADYGNHVYYVKVFAEPGADWSNHVANVNAWIEKAQESAGKAKRARLYGDSHATDARIYLETARKYAGFMGIADRVTIPELDLEALAKVVQERRAQATAAEKAREEARKAEIARRRAALAEMAPRIIDAWRRNGTQEEYTAEGWVTVAEASAALDLGDLMRVHAESGEVVTSRGARIDARIVRAMARRVLQVMTAGTGRNNGPDGLIGRHIGPYIILDVTPEYLKVGCHDFQRAEIERIADALESAEIVPASDKVQA